MPIRRVKGGYKWGKKGKVYRNRKDAERQAAAAYASGYKKSMDWFDTLKIDDIESEYSQFKQGLESQDEIRQIQNRMREIERMNFRFTVSDGKDRMREMENATKEYNTLKRRLSKLNAEISRTRREERRALRPLKEEAKKVKNEFMNKRNVVIQEFLKYVDGFGVDDYAPLNKITDLGTTTATGRVFRKVYERAAKNSGIYGHSKIIDHTNYKDFDVDKKVNDFRDALEEAKEFYKDEIRQLLMSRIRNR